VKGNGADMQSEPNEFLDPELSIDNLDRYYIRKSILNAITQHLPALHGMLLDIGCGEMPYKQYILSNSNVEKYIGLDIKNPKYQTAVLPDLFWDGKRIPLGDNSVDCAMATELFEHLPEIESVLTEINRVLKPGKQLVFTLPFLWPLHDMPQDEFRYTPFSLRRLLENSKFEAVTIEALGGWDASLAQMIGLWVKRSPMTTEARNLFSDDLFSFYKYLLAQESSQKNLSYSDMLTNSTMITGLSGTAVCSNRSNVN
jgi:SAM-dependent methyltransferase